MFVAAIGCTMSKKPMSDKPEPAVAPVSIEDSIMPEKVPADTVAVVTAAPVYPSDEEKDLWVLVDSFRRTIWICCDAKEKSEVAHSYQNPLCGSAGGIQKEAIS